MADQYTETINGKDTYSAYPDLPVTSNHEIIAAGYAYSNSGTGLIAWKERPEQNNKVPIVLIVSGCYLVFTATFPLLLAGLACATGALEQLEQTYEVVRANAPLVFLLLVFGLAFLSTGGLMQRRAETVDPDPEIVRIMQSGNNARLALEAKQGKDVESLGGQASSDSPSGKRGEAAAGEDAVS